MRETERLKFITGRSVASDEDAKSEKKSEKGEKAAVEEEESEEKEEKEEELSPSLQLYNKYLKLEDEVLIKVGLRQPKVEEKKKSIAEIERDRRKSSVKPPELKKFLKP